jgi:hypothetical protein
MRHFHSASEREREMCLAKMSVPYHSEDLSVQEMVGLEVAYNMKVMVRRNNSE